MVNDEFDQEKRELLWSNPLPEVESVYATIQCERDRNLVMTTSRRHMEFNKTTHTGIGTDQSARTSRTKREPGLENSNFLTRHATKLQMDRGRVKSSSRGGGMDQKNIMCRNCGNVLSQSGQMLRNQRISRSMEEPTKGQRIRCRDHSRRLNRYRKPWWNKWEGQIQGTQRDESQRWGSRAYRGKPRRRSLSI